MKKIIRAELTEQSKAVVAKVEIEYEHDGSITNKQVLEETKDAFNELHNHATMLTMRKA